jgi:aspartate kinase
MKGAADMVKVAKFGGTSLATGARFLRAKSIIDGDGSRRFIVPSAPGKEHAEDVKVTDLLYLLYDTVRAKQDTDLLWNKIERRFSEICTDLNAGIDISSYLAEEYGRIISGTTRDYVVSRGEALNGRIMASLLEAEFVDPTEVIRFDSSGRVDPQSYALIADRCNRPGRYVIPGFYGAGPDGEIITFSRGGSDVTGAIVANAMNVDVYENWTDVSGFRMTDPRVVPDANHIAEMTYSELRELSYMGAHVLHEEAIFPVREKSIPINIRNTMEPENNGTMIVPSRDVGTQTIIGIAGKKGFMVFYIQKTMMNEEVGFGRRVLEVFERWGVSYEHTPSGIDTLSVVVSEEHIGHNEARIVEELDSLHPDRVGIIRGIALIATVGQGMNHSVGIAARLFMALSDAGVNVRMIDQGSSEQNIIVGVEETDLDGAVLAIYREFAKNV